MTSFISAQLPLLTAVIKRLLPCDVTHAPISSFHEGLLQSTSALTRWPNSPPTKFYLLMFMAP